MCPWQYHRRSLYQKASGHKWKLRKFEMLQKPLLAESYPNESYRSRICGFDVVFLSIKYSLHRHTAGALNVLHASLYCGKYNKPNINKQLLSFLSLSWEITHRNAFTESCWCSMAIFLLHSVCIAGLLSLR